jgi:hypothetical protein
MKKVILIVLLVLLLAACAPQTPAPRPTDTVVPPVETATMVPPTPALEQTDAPEFPTGRFVNREGDEEYEFNEDGTYSYFYEQSSEPAIVGTYSIDGNLYIEESHTGDCPPTTGIYIWNYDAGILTFRASETRDDCAGRRSAYIQRFSGPQ